MNLAEHLRTVIKPHLLEPSRTISLAYSAGVDSHVLLNLLIDLIPEYPQHRFQAIHVNHGLSINADKWQQHCRQFCETHLIDFIGVKVSIDRQTGQSLEALAREARYAALLENTPNDGVILLAQHQDDQLETLLLQLKRGAGPKGLSSMALCSDSQRGIKLIRPLLDVSQQQIMDYAGINKLCWQEDESNQNLAFERNFLRHQIIPKLTEQWPKFAQSVGRTARLCAEQQQLLDEVCGEKLEALRDQDNTLDVAGLLSYSQPWIFQIVRLWLSEQFITMPSQAILQQLPNLLLAQEDANPAIEWLDWQLRRYQNRLCALPSLPPIEVTNYRLDANKILTLPQSLGEILLTLEQKRHTENLSNETAGLIFEVKFGGYSVKFKPQGANHSKPLKQWFKQWKIPPWQRERVVQIYDQDSLIAVLVNEQFILAHVAEKQDHSQQLSLHYTRQGRCGASAIICR
jgi:tRNA(Ile)-lysidine synthase